MCEYCEHAFGQDNLIFIESQQTNTDTGVPLLNADLCIGLNSTLDFDVYLGNACDDVILAMSTQINYCPICGAKLPKKIES